MRKPCSIEELMAIILVLLDPFKNIMRVADMRYESPDEFNESDYSPEYINFLN